jgi:hypothetical protein
VDSTLGVRCEGALMRMLCVFLIALLGAGCTTQRDYDFVVGHAITSLDAHADIRTVVLASSLPVEARIAAAKHYKTIEESAVIPTPGYDMAPGLFLLSSVEISGDTAKVIGRTGPDGSAGSRLGCGASHQINYQKVEGGWRVGLTESTVC